MIQYALIVSLLLELGRRLRGLQLPQGPRRAQGCAFAVDITAVLTSDINVRVLLETLRVYEQAITACLNNRKCQDLTLGSWNTGLNMMGIPHVQGALILGFRFCTTLRQTTSRTWTAVIARVRVALYAARYMNKSHLSRIQYFAQVFPMDDVATRRLNMAIS